MTLMATSAELLTFAGIMAIGQFTPGPDLLLVTRTALTEGVRAGMAVALGIATGLCIYGTLAVGGAAVLLEKIPYLRPLMLWLAAFYLLWLGWKLVRAGIRAFALRSRNEEQVLPLKIIGNPYLAGLLCNLLNPKLVIFLSAVVTPVLKGDHPDWWPWSLWAVIVIQGGCLWMLWAIFLQWHPVKQAYLRSQPVIDVLFAIGLWALALKLVWPVT